MSYSHRMALWSDLPAIVAIYNSTIPSGIVTADLSPVSVESRQSWFADHASEKRPLWVAEENGKINGWLSYSNFYGRPAYEGTAELSVYIDQAARRKGIGHYLLMQAIEFAPQIGIHTLLAFIFEQNLPSLRLFEGLEFAHWGKLPKVARIGELEHSLIIVGRRCV